MFQDEREREREREKSEIYRRIKSSTKDVYVLELRIFFISLTFFVKKNMFFGYLFVQNKIFSIVVTITTTIPVIIVVIFFAAFLSGLLRGSR